MKKKLTLNQAWTKCLRMWKWIAVNLGKEIKAYDLKIKWLEQYETETLFGQCYFCEYAEQQDLGGDCELCPGVLVDKTFNCSHQDYTWHENPKGFLKKIVALNKKRKAK